MYLELYGSAMCKRFLFPESNDPPKVTTPKAANSESNEGRYYRNSTVVKYCRERFVLMLESVKSDLNLRQVRLLTNAASSRIRLHFVALNIISFDYFPQHKCLHFPPYQLLHVLTPQNPRYSRFSPVI